SRIRYQKVCPTCGVVVQPEDIAKAAPLPDGRFVLLESEDSTATDNSDRTITILSFHPLDVIDPAYYQQAYWVKPGPGGHKPYRLLIETMNTAGQVALAQFALRQRSRLAVVRPFHKESLMLHSMHYPESLRMEGSRIEGPAAAITEKERDMAIALIDHMQGPFIPEQYPNEEKRRLLAEIERLMPSARLPEVVPGAAADEVIDLMAQLQASIARKTRTPNNAS
ncbi:MAG: non-homologous end joining protein Ku, partial [Sulfobacillus sp.]